MVESNPINFQKSITAELDILKNRVRDLIWGVNRSEEWRYKEAILKNMINRFLPTWLSIWTWFIKSKDVISTQIDLIIYDNRYPIFFIEWDFIVVSKIAVMWIIEVKSKIYKTWNTTLENTINKIIDIKNRFQCINDEWFVWIFSFESEININNEYDLINNNVTNSWWYVNHISLWPNQFIKYRPKWTNKHLTWNAAQTNQYRLYDINDLWFSYFIWNLINKLTDLQSADTRFYFPLTEGVWKEICCVNSVDLIL